MMMPILPARPKYDRNIGIDVVPTTTGVWYMSLSKCNNPAKRIAPAEIMIYTFNSRLFFIDLPPCHKTME
jgi:hypothetical protein